MKTEYEANEALHSRVAVRQQSQAWMQPSTAKRKQQKHSTLRHLMQRSAQLGTALMLMALTGYLMR